MIGAAGGNCTHTCSVAGSHSAVKSQPLETIERSAFGFALRALNEIKKAGSVIALPAHAISTKNKHLLVIYSIPTRGFTAAVSVFKGTPPPKPLECTSPAELLTPAQWR
jgi:hypothetical protein